MWKLAPLYSRKGNVELDIERWSIREKDNQRSGLILVLTRSTFAVQLGSMTVISAFPFHPDTPQMASGVPASYVLAHIYAQDLQKVLFLSKFNEIH